jgi:hypothetical protein
MDLTTSYPSSVREQLHGIVQLKRTIDKGLAVAAGTPGEYHYNCPMDKAVFAFLGIDHEALMNVIKANPTNRQAIDNYVAPFVHAKSDAEIADWNAHWLEQGPAPGTDSAKFFEQLRGEVAPDRTDVTSWPDLLDLDEKRPVPRRVPA